MNKQKTSGIYLGKKYGEKKAYLGLSTGIEGRIAGHLSQLKNNSHKENPHLQNAWNLYGENAFVWGIIEECSVELLSEREIFWEQKLKSEGWELYNSVPCGGRPPIHYGDASPSKRPEVRKKISEGNKNKPPRSAEYREKQRKAKLGKKTKPCSPEKAKKIGDAQRADKNHRAKLTWDKVREIRRLRLLDPKLYTQQKLGNMFGVSRGCIKNVVLYLRWVE